MHKLSTRIALLAVVGSMTAITPVLAAPQSHGPNTPGGIDCTLAQNAKNPFCLQVPGHGRNKSRPGGDNSNHRGDNNGPGATQGGNNSSSAPPSANNDNNNDHNNDHRGPPNGSNNGDHHQPGNHNGGMDRGPQHGSFNWSRHDRDQFHQRFRGFNFGFFGVPTFSIHIGTTVPRSFDLRPVPRSIYRDYPWFRGYLFFVTRGGDIVIVSPRSHRIVGII